MPTTEEIPEMDLNPVPYSIETRSVGGFEASSLLRVANSGTPAAAAVLSSSQFSELQNLINGSSLNYMSSVAGSTTGARLPTVSGNPSSPAVGSIWFDTQGAGTLKYYDSSGTIRTIGTGSGNGTLTGLTAGTGLSGGGSSGVVSLALTPSGVGAGGTYGSSGQIPRLEIDTYGRITNVSLQPISGMLPSPGSAGEILRSNGAAWLGGLLRSGDVRSLSDNASIFPATSCAASQALIWNSGSDKLECQTINLGVPSATVAATYTKVNVAPDGRVNGGSNPTTLAAYGITDALRSNGGIPDLTSGNTASRPPAGNAGRLYVDQQALTLYRDNGSAWDVIGSTGAGGSLTGVTATAGLTGGGSAGNVSVGLSTAGVAAGTFYKVTTDSYGRVSSGSGSLVATDIPALDWTKIVSGKPTSLAGYGISDALVENAGGATSIRAGNTAGRGAAGTAGRIYLDTQANIISYDDGSTWQTLAASTANGFNGSLGGDVTGTQTATIVSQVGGASASAVAAATGVANAATDVNSALTVVKRDAGGNFSASSAQLNTLALKDSGGHTATFSVPSSLATSYTLKFPPALGSANQVLTTDATGNLSWSSPSSATVVGVSAPLTLSGTSANPNVGISQASTTQSGYLSSTDWNAFADKLSKALNSASIWVGNASNFATAVAPSGDIALSNTGAFTVNGIKNQIVSTQASATGQVLRYEGSNTWTPRFLAMADLRSTVTGAAALSSGCTAGQTLTWNSGTDNLQCQAISIAAATQITGQVPVANGGTGTATTSQNFVFAGPTSGSGAPAFRALADADLPSSASAWTVSASDVYRSSGRVGIGTSAPLEALQAIGNFSAYNGGNNADDGGAINFGVAAASDYSPMSSIKGVLAFVPGSSTEQQGGIAFNTRPTGVAGQAMAERMRISHDGKVGIGTASPIYNTDIYSVATGGTSLRINNADAGGRGYAFISTGTTSVGGAGKFTLFDTTASVARMTVDSGGNVGIGTTAPAYPVDIINPAPILRIGTSTLTGGGVYLGNPSHGIVRGYATGIGTNDLGVYTTNADLYLSSNGQSTGYFVLKNSGNVGIGTLAPNSKLHVNGARVSIWRDVAGEARFHLYNAGATAEWLLGQKSGTDHNFTISKSVAGSELDLLSATPTGNIGIGTSSPQAGLDVKTTGAASAIIVPRDTVANRPATAVNGMIRYASDTNVLEAHVNGAWVTLGTLGGAQSFAGNVSVGGTLTATGAATFNGGATVAGGALDMSSQNITGVGSNITGAADLGISSTGAGSSIAFTSGTSGAVNSGSANGTSLSVLSPPPSSVNYITIRGAATGSSPVIGTGGADTNINLTFAPKGTGRSVFANGNVGVGTAVPNETLQVNGRFLAGNASSLAGLSGSPMYVNNAFAYVDTAPVLSLATWLGTGNYGSTLNFFQSGGSSQGDYTAVAANAKVGAIEGFAANGTAPAFVGSLALMADGAPSGSNVPGRFLFSVMTPSGSVVQPLVVKSSGNVGVGTLTPTEKLHVVGSLRVQGSTDCTLGNGAGGTNCSSDIRLKENVTEINKALDKILSLRGVEFIWNHLSSAPGRRDIGVIAQEVEKVFPSAVVSDTTTGFKKVDYAVLIAPLIQAVKELEKRLTETERHHSEARRQIVALRTENDDLRQSVQDVWLKLNNKDSEIAAINSRAELSNARFKRIEEENSVLKARLRRIESILESKK